MLMSRTTSRMHRSGEDFDTAGRIVKRGFSIFSLNDNGDPVQWEWDEYLYRITINKNGFNAGVAREFAFAILESGQENIFRNGNKKKGNTKEELDKTFLTSLKPNDNSKKAATKTESNDQQTLLNVARNIVDKIHIAYFIGKKKSTDNLLDSLQNAIYFKELSEEFVLQFGIEPEHILQLIRENSILQELTSRSLYANINASKKNEDNLIEEFSFV